MTGKSAPRRPAAARPAEPVRWGGLSAPGLFARILVLVLALLFYLVNADEADIHNEDFLPHWTLARLTVRGHGPAAYDYATQAALWRAELPAAVPPELLAHRLSILRTPHTQHL